MNILFADSSPMTLNMYQRCIRVEASGIRTYTARTKDEALDILENHPIEKMTCGLVGFNFEFIQYVKKEFPKTELIVISGFTDSGYAGLLDAFGVKYYDKPIDVPTLVQALNLKNSETISQDTKPRLKVKVQITLSAEVILDNPDDLKNIVMHETDYIAEPNSNKGCITIKRVDSYQKCSTVKEVK